MGAAVATSGPFIWALMPIPVSNSGSISGVTAMLAEHVFLYTLALLRVSFLAATSAI
jgi:uncharacterized membrane protein YtjA (UPF0391 family)